MIRAYLYDGENVVRESDGDADPVRDFTSTDEQYGALLSEYDPGGGETLYHDYDGLGSTSELFTDSGLVSDRYQYRAFGLQSHTSILAGPEAAALPLVPGRTGAGVPASGTRARWVLKLRSRLPNESRRSSPSGLRSA